MTEPLTIALYLSQNTGRHSSSYLLTELWSSKEEWDVYFAMAKTVRDENGWNARFLPLLEEDGVQITFSEMDKSL